MNSYTELRRRLHQNPELSCEEGETQKILLDFLKAHSPTAVIPLAEDKALLVEFDSGIKGPHTVFRADLDALPIQEESQHDYISKTPGVSHKCGHDGHMTLAATLPEIWNSLKKKSGKLGLLFQHGEEVAVGAREIIEDPEFKKWKPDFILGLHNLPGYKTQDIVMSEDVFSCSSMGLRISAEGLGSHAGEPEKGISPLPLLNQIVSFTQSLVNKKEDDHFFLSTMVHFKVGEENYGISPGEGKVCFTLRSKYTDLLQTNKKKILDKAHELGKEMGISIHHEEFDFFPATINNPELVKKVSESVNEAGLNGIKKSFPFRWSEDFGYYREVAEAAFFGIGNGEESFPLHHPQYDFNEGAIKHFQDLMGPLLKNLNS